MGLNISDIVTSRKVEFKDLKRIQQKVGTTIQHSRIPTGREIRRSYVSNLLHDIQQQPINPDAGEVLDALAEEMDVAQINFKLISYLLQRHTVTGPESIGIDDERLKRILKQIASRDRKPYQRRRPSGGRGSCGKGTPRSTAGSRSPCSPARGRGSATRSRSGSRPSARAFFCGIGRAGTPSRL